MSCECKTTVRGRWTNGVKIAPANSAETITWGVSSKCKEVRVPIPDEFSALDFDEDSQTASAMKRSIASSAVIPHEQHN